MRRSLVLVLAAACALPDAPSEAPDFSELETPIAATSCPEQTAREVCSGTGLVWTSMYRAGRSADALGELAQTFRVKETGQPASVRLKLRLLRDVTATPAPKLVVSLRPVSGTVPALTGDFATAEISLDGLSRGLPKEHALTFTSTTPANPVVLQPGTTYALVFRAEVANGAVAHVGVASHRSDLYEFGTAFRRTAHAVAGEFPEKPWIEGVDGADLSFSLTVATPTCSDDLKNQDETDVDCGGATCSPCAAGAGCGDHSDCDGGACVGDLCQAPSCDDGLTNGSETGLDCGGPDCAACANGLACDTGTDCQHSFCNASNTCGYATSCRGIQLSDLTAGDGLYSIDPDGPTGDAPIQTECLMSKADGGWTLVQRTVWDWNQSSLLMTNHATFYGTTLGAATPGSAFRVAGKHWPTLDAEGRFLMVHTVRRQDGLACAPLYYPGLGTWNVSSGGASVSVIDQGSVTIHDGSSFSTTNLGPSAGACVNSYNAVPWTYTNCCSTCPTFGSPYFTTPRPMAIYTASVNDLYGNRTASVCAGAAPVVAGSNPNYNGMDSMAYYLR